jgi:hypothetical protein
MQRHKSKVSASSLLSRAKVAETPPGDLRALKGDGSPGPSLQASRSWLPSGDDLKMILNALRRVRFAIRGKPGTGEQALINGAICVFDYIRGTSNGPASFGEGFGRGGVVMRSARALNAGQPDLWVTVGVADKVWRWRSPQSERRGSLWARC